ncbi:MAG: hypothetical protein QXG81_00155 [Ignisphaera sp.]
MYGLGEELLKEIKHKMCIAEECLRNCRKYMNGRSLQKAFDVLWVSWVSARLSQGLSLDLVPHKFYYCNFSVKDGGGEKHE